MRFIPLIGCAAAMLVAMPAQALLIDNYDSGTDFLVAPVIPGPSNTAAAGAIGGSRTLAIAGGSATGTSIEVTPAGTLSHGQTTSGGGMSTVTWDANGVGLGGVDLTTGGFDIGILVDIISIDVGMVTLEFMITDTVAQMSTLAHSGLGAGNNTFLYSDFVGSADLTMVDSIVFKITAEADSDLEIDFVETTPPEDIAEPSVLALTLGLAGGVLLLRRRR